MSREPVRTARAQRMPYMTDSVGSRSFAEFTGSVCFTREEIMSTQADNAAALGKSLDGSGLSPVPPSGFPHGTTATHEMLNIDPADIQRDDILRWHGAYRTVSTSIKVRIGPNKGQRVVYFRDDGGEPASATIAEGVLAVTVYRPKHRPASYL